MKPDARLIAALTVCALWSAAAAAAGLPVSLPMTLEGDRPYVDVQFTGTDGKPVQVHAWLDTGGGAIILTQQLADALGLAPIARGFKADGDTLAEVPVPALDLGSKPVKLEDAHAYEVLTNAAGLQGTDAEAAIPVRLLRGYDVVFDYPAGRFSLDKSGGAHKGTPVPVHIGAAGMPTVTLQIDGKPYGFLLDTGGTCVMLSQAAMIGMLHPDSKRLPGAYGPGNMLLGKFETQAMMLDMPKLSWGPFQLEHVLAVSRPEGIYEQHMSQLTGAPIVGSLGGNVLHSFRVDIDYPQAKLYLTEAKGAKPVVLDMVGVMLEPAQGGGYDVGMVQGDTGGIAVGDHLLKVGDVDATQAVFRTVMAALSGKPGESRSVTVQRDGKTLTFQAPVQHLLGAGT